jgi:hypothetical protein
MASFYAKHRRSAMNGYSIKSLAAAVVAVLAATCMGFAWAGTMGTHVDFYTTMRFDNGEVLHSGRYWMEVPKHTTTPTVEFIRDYQVRATVPAEVVNQSARNASTTTDSVKDGNQQLVTAIHPQGWKEAIVFPQAQQEARNLIRSSNGGAQG